MSITVSLARDEHHAEFPHPVPDEDGMIGGLIRRLRAKFEAEAEAWLGAEPVFRSISLGVVRASEWSDRVSASASATATFESVAGTEPYESSETVSIIVQERHQLPTDGWRVSMRQSMFSNINSILVIYPTLESDFGVVRDGDTLFAPYEHLGAIRKMLRHDIERFSRVLPEDEPSPYSRLHHIAEHEPALRQKAFRQAHAALGRTPVLQSIEPLHADVGEGRGDLPINPLQFGIAARYTFA